MLRQRPYTQFDMPQAADIKLRGQMGRQNANKSWSQAILGNHHASRSLGQLSNDFSRFDILGRVKIMNARRMGSARYR
jgi:hypothetical protein